MWRRVRWAVACELRETVGASKVFFNNKTNNAKVLCVCSWFSNQKGACRHLQARNLYISTVAGPGAQNNVPNHSKRDVRGQRAASLMWKTASAVLTLAFLTDSGAGVQPQQCHRTKAVKEESTRSRQEQLGPSDGRISNWKNGKSGLLVKTTLKKRGNLKNDFRLYWQNGKVLQFIHSSLLKTIQKL